MTEKICNLRTNNPLCSLHVPKQVCMAYFKFYLFSGFPTYRVMQCDLEVAAFQALC